MFFDSSFAARWVALAALCLSACTAAGNPGTPEVPGARDGKADGAHTEGPSLYRRGNRFGEESGDAFLDDVGPVFAARCAGCHGCSNAPCQLKLVSYEGIRRGSNTTDLFDGRRILSTGTLGLNSPTRLEDGRYTRADGSIDYESTEAWWRNERDFYSVIDPRGGGGAASSPMHQLLARGLRLNGAAIDETELEAAHTLALTSIDKRTFECLGDSELGVDDNAPVIPEAALQGRAMPFGMAVPPEQQELVNWLDQGAPGPDQAVEATMSQPSAENAAQIATWEELFNRGMTMELNIDAAVAAFSAVYDAEHPGFFNTLERRRAASDFRAAELRRAYQAQHAARYLFEHMYFSRLHFDDGDEGEYFELVRSRTAPGQAIEEIVRTLPSDSPDPASTTVGGIFTANTFYYRFRKHTATIVQKDHVVWHLDEAVRSRLETLFLGSSWGNDIPKPEYRTVARRTITGPENPFAVFQIIPARIRSRFMIENSKYLVDAMVRGDVCTGSRATYAIRDRFWAWFLDPDSDVTTQDRVAIRGSNGLITGYEQTYGTQLGLGSSEHLDPDEPDNDRERTYLATQDALLARHRPRGYSLDDLWDGDGGTNPNAWLTILRHGKSATVHYGAVGGRPETLWVLSYANFERLYYDLVVRFEPWSNIAHKLKTWKVMSYVRAEGEDMFLTFLPRGARQTVREDWTRGFTGPLQQSRFPVLGGGDWHSILFDRSTAVRPSIFEDASQTPLDEADPIGDLIDRVAVHTGTRLEDSLNGRDPVALPDTIATYADFEAGLDAITQVQGEGLQFLPNAMVVRVRVPGEDVRLYTIIANRIYKAHNRVYGEGLVRDPERDTLSAMADLYSNYPELFVDVPIADAREFLANLSDIARSPAQDGAAKWQSVYDTYSTEPAPQQERLHIVARTSPAFWSFFDWVNAWNLQAHPIEAGIMDISEYLWPGYSSRTEVDPRDPAELDQGPF